MQLSKGRKLRNIEVDEVSFTDMPANRKKFLFYKRLGEGAGVGGDRQGIGGAKYCVCPECGYSIKHERSGEGKTKPCAQIKCAKCGTMMVGSETKKLEVSKMEKEVLEILKSMADKGEALEVVAIYKELTGEELTEEEIEKATALPENVKNALKAALNILNKWKKDMPDELQKAVGVLVKYSAAGKYPYPKPYKKSDEGEEEELEKAGKKLSKDTLQQLLSMRKLLDEMLPEDMKKGLEEENEEEDALEILKGIREWMEKAADSSGEDKDSDDTEEEEDSSKGKDGSATEAMGEIAKRLKILEETAGIKKGEESDGSDDKDEEDLWPSLAIS